MLKLYNTRTKQKEDFTPLNSDEVSLYSCGPTVYGYIHIGNHRTFLMTDTLKRILQYNGYSVKHIMNITDVGHLVGDGDSGEDKMEKGSRQQGKTAWEVADFFTAAFKKDLVELNIQEPTLFTKATDHIQEQIDQVQALMDKGYTYETSDGIYMDTTKVKNYGALIDLDKQQLQAGARVEMGEKKDPHDFALWKFSPDGEQRQMEWDAFGRKGFPGWHIECSAMACKYLGDQFDIHTGGIDLSRTHHINEIAQAESITDIHPWVNFWVHGEFLNMGEEKMARSQGNVMTVSKLKETGIDPLDYRYFSYQTHYRKQTTFSEATMQAAHVGLKKLRRQVQEIETETTDPQVEADFLAAINDDMNMPEAMAVLFRAVKEKTMNQETVKKFDTVLGLNLFQKETALQIPAEIQLLLDERKQARAKKDWGKSDALRDTIKERGFIVEDTADGQVIHTD